MIADSDRCRSVRHLDMDVASTARIRERQGTVGLGEAVVPRGVTDRCRPTLGRGSGAHPRGEHRADGTARITVADQGTWRTLDERSDTRGRELLLAQALIGDTRIERTENGTVATAVHPLSRSAHIITEPDTAHTLPTAPSTAFEVRIDDGVVTASGALHTDSVAALAGALAKASHAGTSPITVDLSTHLGSAAIDVLAQARRVAADQGTTCTVIAPPGGTAHHVLSLVDLL